MTPEELSNLYICIAFQYEFALIHLVDKGLVDKDLADATRKTFYESLDEEKLRTSQKIRGHTEIIRHYMRGMACEKLIHQAHMTSLTVTPSLWIRKTYAVGMRVKQGSGGVSAYPEIVADFHIWLDPVERLALVRLVREMKIDRKTIQYNRHKTSAKGESTVMGILNCGRRIRQLSVHRFYMILRITGLSMSTMEGHRQ